MAGDAELSVLAGATRYLLRTLLLIRDTDLPAPTPCRGWDLHHLLTHLRVSLADVTDVLAKRGFDPPGRRAACRDPVAALRAGIVDLLLAATSLPTADRSCRIGGRSVPAKVVVYVGALETVLHAWDIGQSCGADWPIPPDVAAALLWVSPPLARAGLAGHVFAEPLPALPTATPGDQLLALFGRPPSRR